MRQPRSSGRHCHTGAGKAFVRIAPFLDVELAPLPMPGRGKPYVAKGTTLFNPQIDPARLAKILIDARREIDGSA